MIKGTFKKIAIVIITVISIFTTAILFDSIVGYFSKSANIDGTPVITVSRYYWSDVQAEPNEVTTEYVDVKKGDVIFDDGYYKLTVKRISEDDVILSSSGGLIEKNPDGTINLNDEGPKNFTIASDNEMHIASQSMDGGVVLTISYHIG